FAKRNFDLVLALPLFLLLTPFMLIPWFLTARNRRAFNYFTGEQSHITLKQLDSGKWINFYTLLGYIIRGKISFVGAPLIPDRRESMLYYKHGLTGLRQYHESRSGHLDEGEHFELHYLQNYSIWLDLDILAKTLLS